MQFTVGQQLGFNIILNGWNTFITGGGGVGKTELILKTAEHLQNIGKSVMMCAPTGMAALKINGVTVHRQFNAPVGVLNYRRDMYGADDELIKTDVLIMDEVSMCRVDLFDFVCNKVLDANRVRHNMGLEDIQFILVGDFFQLAPVLLPNEKIALDKYYGKDMDAGYAFMSKFWDMFNFVPVILTEVVRQRDNDFILDLNKIRGGDKVYVNYIYENSNKNEIDGAITICGTNSEASEINTRRLREIDEESIFYEAITEGDVLPTDVNADFMLELREGARVIVIINSDESGGYKNGSLGTVVGLYDNEVIVQLDSGGTETLMRYTWPVFRYSLEKDECGIEKLTKQQVGSVTQFPLKLAYAITIHKSQGQTYDKVNLSPYSWDCGQLYVAISRVRSLENLHFNYAPDLSYVVVSLNVIKFHNKLVEIANANGNKYSIEKKQTATKKKSEFDSDMSLLLSGLGGHWG